MNALVEVWRSCTQMRQLMNRCLTQLKLRLTLDNVAEAVVLADKVNSQGLHDACVEFALRKENRCAHPMSHVCLPHAPFSAF